MRWLRRLLALGLVASPMLVAFFLHERAAIAVCDLKTGGGCPANDASYSDADAAGTSDSFFSTLTLPVATLGHDIYLYFFRSGTGATGAPWEIRANNSASDPRDSFGGVENDFTFNFAYNDGFPEPYEHQIHYGHEATYDSVNDTRSVAPTSGEQLHGAWIEDVLDLYTPIASQAYSGAGGTAPTVGQWVTARSAAGAFRSAGVVTSVGSPITYQVLYHAAGLDPADTASGDILTRDATHVATFPHGSSSNDIIIYYYAKTCAAMVNNTRETLGTHVGKAIMVTGSGVSPLQFRLIEGRYPASGECGQQVLSASTTAEISVDGAPADTGGWLRTATAAQPALTYFNTRPYGMVYNNVSGSSLFSWEPLSTELDPDYGSGRNLVTMRYSVGTGSSCLTLWSTEDCLATGIRMIVGNRADSSAVLTQPRVLFTGGRIGLSDGAWNNPSFSGAHWKAEDPNTGGSGTNTYTFPDPPGGAASASANIALQTDATASVGVAGFALDTVSCTTSCAAVEGGVACIDGYDFAGLSVGIDCSTTTGNRICQCGD